MTATTTVQATRPARRKTGAQRRSRPAPSHPTPTRAVPHKPSKPVNDAGSVTRGAPLTQWPAAGTDASRTAAIVVTAASEVLAGLRPVDQSAPVRGARPPRRPGLPDPGASDELTAAAHPQRAHRADDVGSLRGDRPPGGGQPSPGRRGAPGADARALDPHRPGDRVIPPDPGDVPGPDGIDGDQSEARRASVTALLLGATALGPVAARGRRARGPTR